MHALGTLVIAIAPAILLGWLVPSVLRLYGMAVDEPARARHNILMFIALPWFVGAAVWMEWWANYNNPLLKYPLRTSILLIFVLAIAMLTTSLRQYGLPILRRWIHKITA